MEAQTNLKTPVLFLVFNRPEPTQKVFEQIRLAKPQQLFIAADGPRAGKEGEAAKCEAVKQIVSQIDWECDVQTLFREENLGCKQAVSSAINWFFEQVEAGIILEDDCLPNQSFFSYAQTLLEKYRNDDRIMIISGDNFQAGLKRGNASYYFSRYPHIWGWATWRRAWQKYDITMSGFPTFKNQNQIENLFTSAAEQNFWMHNFEEVFQNKVDTWDFQWVYAIYSHDGLCIMPNVNLISNIGFNHEATHTKTGDVATANLPTSNIGELQHPEFVLRDVAADDYSAEHVFHARNAAPGLKSKLKSLIKSI